MALKAEYCRVPIEVIQRYGGEVPFDLYLRLSDDKLVRVGHANDNVKDTVAHYIEKGVKEIFAIKDDYLRFVDLMNKELTSKFFDVDTSSDEKIKILQSSFSVLKEALCKIGIQEKSITLARELAKKSGELISKQMFTKELFAKYKNQCSSEYIRCLFVGSVVMSMFDNLEWQSESVRQHAMEALLLRDILLSPDDFVSLKQNREMPKKLPTHVYNHPLDVVKLMTQDGCRDFSQDVQIMIEQHHERPDGVGFPGQVADTSISLMSAMIIVADEFIDRMIDSAFDFDKRMLVLNELLGIFKKGNYRKALNVLNLGID